jgi:predicted dehydrogenase
VTWRWGVAGPGSIAAQFAEDMARVGGGRITAVASRSPERASAFAGRFGIATCHTGYAALAADPHVDIVYVATPHARHEPDTLRFIEAGKHVLCEKPFALHAGQARRMVAAARARGVFLMEAMWSRFLPAYRTLAAVVRSGRIGEPLVVEADLGFRMPVLPDHRLFDRALGGGALLDVGVYPIQLCSLVLGAPDRVVADGVVGPTGVDEHVAAVMHHAGGGLGIVKAAIRVDLSCRARISGSEGWVDIPPLMHQPDRIIVGGHRGTERLDAPFDGVGLRFQVEEVHRCLEAGSTESEVMPLDESIRIAATMDAIRAQAGVIYADESVA